VDGGDEPGTYPVDHGRCNGLRLVVDEVGDRTPSQGVRGAPDHLREGVVARGDGPRDGVDRQEADRGGVDVVPPAGLAFWGQLSHSTFISVDRSCRAATR